jgi:GT2 family glycosyltransferase
VPKPIKKVLQYIEKKIGLHTRKKFSDNNNKEYLNSLIYKIVTGQKPTEINRDSAVDVIIPIYNAFEPTVSCISSVLKNSENCRLILVNDASTDRRIEEYLNSVHSIPQKKIEVVVRNNQVNVGFLKTVNDAYNLTTRHFVILNSDTEVPPSWLDRLFAPIFISPDYVASVTPFSNAAMGWLGCNFPDVKNDSNIFKELSVAQLDSFFLKYSPSDPIELFSGCGFCMAFNRAVVEQLGFFNHKDFGRGYCEEVDWSLRAFIAGYKNVLAPNLFVFHKYGASFGLIEKSRLQEANFKKLCEIHGTHMKRMNATSNTVRSIIDTIAVIADVHTKKNNEYLIAILGAEKADWDVIQGHLTDVKYSYNTNGFIFITAPNEINLKLHIVTSHQNRIIHLPPEAGSYMNKLLTLLSVDVAVIVENTTCPNSINLLQQVELANIHHSIINAPIILNCRE